MEDQNNIRVILSDKAEIALEEIINAFNLQDQDDSQNKDESPDVIIDRLIKDFARGGLTEKNFIASLQNDLKISQETAEKLSKEIITKIVPIVEKFPEEKFKDPVFVETLSEKIFGTQETENKNKPSNVLPKIKPPISVTEVLNKNVVKTPEIEIKTDVPKKPTANKESVKTTIVKQNNKPRGKDTYREPIE